MNRMTNSHILVPEFEYLEPRSVDEAVSLLSQYGDRARVLSGGTDLIVQMKMERLSPDYVVSIRRIAGLGGIAFGSESVHIGAVSSIWSIRNNPAIQTHYPALAEACASFSTTQVQFMGTVGGNLCNGSPASDSAPALIVLGARAVIASVDGRRQLPLEEFFLGPGKTALQRGELLVGVVVPRPQPRTGSAFLKVSRVTADLAKVNAAVMLVREGDHIADCRLTFGSVGPVPMRAAKAEALLTGQEAARIAAEEASPIDDVRSTASYRREIVRVLTYDGLHKAWDRAEQAAEEWKGGGPEERGGGEGEAQRVAATFAPDSESSITRREVALTVNGIVRRLSVAPNELLLNVLRERLSLTGSKYGCGIGECGACTVHIDGEPMLSCLTLAISAHGRNIVTVEGLQGPDGELDPLQEAFIEHSASQCGYCTPGMLMTAKKLLKENASPTEEQVRDYLKGNLCRCTGYASIVRAVMGSAEATSASG